MLTNEKVLNVFADYLQKDEDYEVVLTSHGYTVMGWDRQRQDWNNVVFCPTPESLRDALLDAYASFAEMTITDCDRDLTPAEEKQIAQAQQALTAACEKEGDT